jgi:hypothetical protein
MNSDRHEAAAWRTFGMLDTDEAVSFDHAMREDPALQAAYREMNCISVAVAIASVQPLKPKANQLERLHSRLGLNIPKPVNWIGISGWAAAALLLAMLVINQNHARQSAAARHKGHSRTVVDTTSSVALPASASSISADAEDSPPALAPVSTSESDSEVIIQESDAKTNGKSETKRLIQEIEILREKLESAQNRDKKRFEPIPGMAWPIIVTMSPPGATNAPSGPIAMSDSATPITSVIGDALVGITSIANLPPVQISSVPTIPSVPAPPSIPTPLPIPTATTPTESPTVERTPSAIPIYDSARDSGTLVINNLPAAGNDEAYNLWVTTEDGVRPIHVGRLPSTTARGADSFDFNLGSRAIIPSSFYLTKDSKTQARAPTEANTVLQGPR